MLHQNQLLEVVTLREASYTHLTFQPHGSVTQDATSITILAARFARLTFVGLEHLPSRWTKTSHQRCGTDSKAARVNGFRIVHSVGKPLYQVLAEIERVTECYIFFASCAFY